MAAFLLHVFRLPFTTHNAAVPSGFPFTTQMQLTVAVPCTLAVKLV
jgi:hypothetical protein